MGSIVSAPTYLAAVVLCPALGPVHLCEGSQEEALAVVASGREQPFMGCYDCLFATSGSLFISKLSPSGGGGIGDQYYLVLQFGLDITEMIWNVYFICATLS